jgi:hypothetical protein
MWMQNMLFQQQKFEEKKWTIFWYVKDEGFNFNTMTIT